MPKARPQAEPRPEEPRPQAEPRTEEPRPRTEEPRPGATISSIDYLMMPMMTEVTMTEEPKSE
jgi:hypothetical protein